jgi:5-formyltetrahydrofolate cyclo-ligase
MSAAVSSLPSESKQALRLQWRRRRREALPPVETLLQRRALAQVPLLLGAQGWLGISWPLAGEADLRCLAAVLPGRLALPAIVDDHLVYRPWSPNTALAKDACGIPAPVQDIALAAETMALLLVPALAIDQHGIRLGSGGGWYDRLRAAPAWRAVPALAVLPAACVVEALPSDPWDVPFDGWLDERGCHWIRPAAVHR